MKICKRNGCVNVLIHGRKYCDDCDVMLGSHTRFSTKLGTMIDRAKQRKKYVVDIKSDDIAAVWPIDNKCPVFGTTLSCEGKRRTSPSLDRIDPNKGYVPGNIQVVSELANRIKTDATNEELKVFANWILNT